MLRARERSQVRVEILRSKRRKKTVAARFAGDTMQVRAPADLPEDALNEIIDQLRPRLERERQQRQARASEELATRAEVLNRRYFSGRLAIRRVGYVRNQRHRFGSCSPHDGVIRVSHRVAAMPSWVIDYVLVHEMAHLVEPNHSSRFWALVSRYPRAERARGFLMGISAASAAGDA
jgi:predicted metal-dependent hydrolase